MRPKLVVLLEGCSIVGLKFLEGPSFNSDAPFKGSFGRVTTSAEASKTVFELDTAAGCISDLSAAAGGISDLSDSKVNFKPGGLGNDGTVSLGA